MVKKEKGASTGKCLCGALAWTISGNPRESSHCHCGMCRKAHGASFATWYFYDAAQFHWNGSIDTLKTFRSSEQLSRGFCSLCGSMVPCCSDEGDSWFVPAGSHQDGPAVKCHIFVNSKAPWLEINDPLPKHPGYPEGEDMNAYPDKINLPQERDIIRGSCLCEAIAFVVTQPFRVIHNCHCSRCRQSRAAAYATNGFVAAEGLQFVRGEEQITTFALPDARFFSHAFCQTCGSSMPRINARMKITMVPMGALDDDPGQGPVDHIFTADKAQWFEIGDTLAQFEGPPD